MVSPVQRALPRPGRHYKGRTDRHANRCCLHMSFSHFLVIGPNDSSVFEYCRPNDSDSALLTRQLMLYSSLDLIDDVVWTRGDFFLSKVDRPAGDACCVSAFIGLAPVKLIVLQDTEPKDTLRTFLSDAYELCVRHLLNPFCEATRKIESAQFQDEMNALCRRSL